jgi:hypothetical protein
VKRNGKGTHLVRRCGLCAFTRARTCAAASGTDLTGGESEVVIDGIDAAFSPSSMQLSQTAPRRALAFAPKRTRECGESLSCQRLATRKLLTFGVGTKPACMKPRRMCELHRSDACRYELSNRKRVARASASHKVGLVYSWIGEKRIEAQQQRAKACAMQS